MAEKKSILRLVQAANQQQEDDDRGAAVPERTTPDVDTMLSTVEMLRRYESQYGNVPSSEVTKQRLLNKYQQSPSQRGELGAGAQLEQHPLLSNYLRGIDDSVNPSLQHMTEEELQQFEQELQYQQRKRLEKQLNLSSAPTLTR